MRSLPWLAILALLAAAPTVLAAAEEWYVTYAPLVSHSDVAWNPARVSVVSDDLGVWLQILWCDEDLVAHIARAPIHRIQASGTMGVESVTFYADDGWGGATYSVDRTSAGAVGSGIWQLIPYATADAGVDPRLCW